MTLHHEDLAANAKTHESERIELALLRDFYTKWAGLHSIPRDKLHRKKQERAAQDMVDAAHCLANFYKVNAEPDKPLLELVHG